MKRHLLAALVSCFVLASAAWALPPPREGEVRFDPTDKEPSLGELFRMAPHAFPFRQEFQKTVSTAIEISLVTFPSPVETPHPNNNTVHCEYFRPLTPGKHTAVVALHILGGDFDLSRLFCRQLAQNGVAALFVKMPYYGPRQQPGSPARMISEDPEGTVAGMRQAVLDIRRGAAWLAAQDEVDADDLGIFGISLGGITGALASTAEPRFQKICLLLAGGDMAQIAWQSPELSKVREKWLARGGDQRKFYDTVKQIDPVTYGANVRGRKILMLNASHDEVIPKECTESLWRSFGEPEIVWMDAGHYSAVRFIFDGLARATKFFQAKD
ncbi:MAG: alpha/beta hydrolase family protein [Planctomycetia bacterium]|nr:alpha/beta hydrolase family protein [Planctomycetia bacterium]